MVVPGILLTIACIQGLSAYGSTLTHWKGGGFGMFATLDRPDNRFLSVLAVDEAERTAIVRVPVGRFPAADALSETFVSRTIAFPTSRRLTRIAEAVLKAHLAPSTSDPRRAPTRLAYSPYGPLLEQAMADRGALEILALERLTTSVRVREVRARVLRLRFDRATQRVRFDVAGPTATVTSRDGSAPPERP